MCSAKHQDAKKKKWATLSFSKLSETVSTTRCSSCLLFSKEGTVYCLCGQCLMPSLEQTEKIKNRIDIISDPLYVVKQEHMENALDLRNNSAIIGKPKMPQRMSRKEDTQPSRKDGKMTLHIEKFNRNMDGKTKRTLERCQFKMISKKQPDLLLWLNTRTEWETPNPTKWQIPTGAD